MKPTTIQHIFYAKALTPLRAFYLTGRYMYRKHVGSKNLSRSISRWYDRKTGGHIDINNPKTLSEKIQWLKLNDSTEIKGKLSDKYDVREWVGKTIGSEYLIPIYGVWDDPDDIDFEKLPDSFVLKSTHGSGMNLFIKNIHKENINKLRRIMKRWIHTEYEYLSAYEMHYKYCTKRVIAEKYMGSKDGSINDYKFMMFNGELQYIWVDEDRFSGHKRAVYDSEWTEMPFQIHTYPKCQVKKPANLELMKELASKLSKPFALVRVDLYEIEGRVWFGEMTFTSSSGSELFYPTKWDKYYGDKLKL